MADEPSTFLLLTNAQVASDGVFLTQVVASEPPLPRLRLADAPEFGRITILTRAQISAALQNSAPQVTATNWAGARQIRISRRARPLGEAELNQMVSAQLQREQVRDRGELELHLLRPWTEISVPDELLSVKLLDLPVSGVSANFILRFELSTAREVVGTWQIPVQAKIWREVWVAHTPLVRGELLSTADLAQERRDILTCRDLLPEQFDRDSQLELTENIPAGTPLSPRSIKPRPLVKRGQIVEALLQDGALLISLKVEVMENGIFGQTVRVRNPQSRREFRGKVQNEQIILVAL